MSGAIDIWARRLLPSASPDGRRIVAVQFLHAAAAGVILTIAPWAILDAGDHIAGAVLVMAASVAAYMGAAPLVGVLADRADARWVIGIAEALVACAALGWMWVVQNTDVVWWSWMVVAAVAGGARCCVEAATFAAVPRLRPGPGMLRAQGMVASAFVVGLIAGPVIAGICLSAAGIGGAMFAVAGLHSFAGAIVLGMSGRLAPTHVPPSAGKSLVHGIRVISHEAEVRTLMLVGMGWGAAIACVSATLVVHLRVNADAGGLGVSIVAAAGMVGALAAARALVLASRRWRDTHLVPAAVGVFGVAMIGLASSRGVALAAVCVLVVYLAQAMGVGALSGARARRTPPHLQAVVGVSGRMMVNSGALLGSLAVGFASARVGVDGALIGGALWALSVAGVGAWVLRRSPER